MSILQLKPSEAEISISPFIYTDSLKAPVLLCTHTDWGNHPWVTHEGQQL